MAKTKELHEMAKPQKVPEAQDFINVHLPWFNRHISRGSFDHKAFLEEAKKRNKAGETSQTKETPPKTHIITNLPCITKEVSIRRGQLTRPKTPSATVTRTMQLPWVVFENPCPGPVVLLITSVTESVLKYAEVVHSLVDECGCSVYTMELRCQGFSSRSLDPEKVHVDSFKEYFNDVLSFIDNVVHPNMDIVGRNREDLSVLGVGIGGLIASYLATRYERIFQRMVLISPILGITKLAWKKKVSMRLKCKIKSKGRQFPKKNRFASQTESVVSNRQKHWQQLQQEMGLETQPTNNWVRALSGTNLPKSRLAPAFEGVPVLVITGGADSSISLPHVQDFVNRVPLCNHRHFSDGNHDVLFDNDHIRTSAMFEATKFLKNDFSSRKLSHCYGWGESGSSESQSIVIDTVGAISSAQTAAALRL
jgi:alpha-beta hydrolase superfamily lysophospholipase